MKHELISCCLAAAFALAGASAVAATRREARAAFEREWEPAFRGRTALPAELAGEGLCDFTATGVVWTIALPVDSDSRLRFVKAAFRDGAFASGTLHVMGLPEAKLAADDFAALRKDFPMLAACDRKGAPACLLYPTKRQRTMSVPEKQAIGLGFNPLGELYGGSFVEALGRLHVSLGKVRCRVDFTGPDGKAFALGETGISRGPEQLTDKTILAALGAERSDLVSERERVEYYLKGRLGYELVLPEEKKEVK